MSQSATEPKGNNTQLIAATLSFAFCFAVFGSISAMMPILSKKMGLTGMQVSVAVALPVLLGSLGRLPLGMATDRFGGRIVFSLTMLARDLAEVTRRAAIPVGVVLVASQADRIRSTIAAKPPSGEGYFLFDGPTDPAMRGGAKVQISPASAPSSKR